LPPPALQLPPFSPRRFQLFASIFSFSFSADRRCQIAIWPPPREAPPARGAAA
jgi:hypothetical protein